MLSSWMDALLRWAEDLIQSFWIYPLLTGFSAFDAVVPALPSESLVIAAASYSHTTGSPNILLVIVCAAIGAVLGDHLAYFIGRTFSTKVIGWLEKSPSRKKMLDWAREGLRKRGGSLLIIARFIPGGRTALTMTMGATKHPLSHFTPWDIAAGVLWAIYAVLMGYAGGWIGRLIGVDIHANPMWAVGIGLVLAIGLAGLTELVRARLERRSASTTEPAAGTEPPAASSPPATGTTTSAGTTTTTSTETTALRPSQQHTPGAGATAAGSDRGEHTDATA